MNGPLHQKEECRASTDTFILGNDEVSSINYSDLQQQQQVFRILHNNNNALSVHKRKRHSESSHTSGSKIYHDDISTSATLAATRQRAHWRKVVHRHALRRNPYCCLIRMIILCCCCCVIVILPVPMVLGDDTADVQNTPLEATTLVIPQFRIEPIEFHNGGIVLPAFFMVQDPELNVTPAPTTIIVNTASPITPRPITQIPTTPSPITIIPTRSPTTNTPTTMTPITVAPTTVAVLPTNAPTYNPTTEVKEQPSTLPSHQPVYASEEPSLQPSFGPSRTPIVPTRTPTTIEPVTKRPISAVPTTIPSLPPTVTAITTPAPQQFVNVTVPLGFAVDVMVRQGGSVEDDMTSALTRMEQIWEESLLTDYTNAFAGRKGIRPLSVDLTISQRQQRRQQRSLRWMHQHHHVRWIQETTRAETVTIQAVGGVNFAVDELLVDPESFVTRAQEELPATLTANQLQTAINDAGATNDVTVVSEISTIPTSPAPPPPEEPETDDSTDRSSTNRKPSKAEIVLGFTLLVATLASLVFWAHVLWNKRKKRLRQRRLESLRKMQSLTYQSSLDQSLPPTAPIISTSPQPGSTTTPTKIMNRGGMALPPESGMSKADTHEGTSGDDDRTSDESDPFARELQKAASFDRAAWEVFERRKKPDSSKDNSNSDVGVARASNVSMHDTIGGDSRDIGVEVQPRTVGSFPYGDENHNRSTTPIRLSNKNAVPWTVAGISLAPFTKRQNENDRKNKSANFSPYGDRSGRSLQESWDLDEFPVKDETGPSQFSFLYPLRRQEINAEIPDARRSPDSDASIRDDSLEVTSVGTPDYSNSVKVREVRKNDIDNDDESDNVSQSAITASMLKELDDIANFVKQYEELKKSRVPVAQQSSSGGLKDATNNQQSEAMKKSNNNGPVMPSKYAVQAIPGLGNPRFVKSRSDETSLGLSDEEDDDGTASVLSQRLGISRISVERPGAAPLLTYKNSQDDPLQWEMDTADLSPFPSSDIDSLRYSPSQSFEKQQVAINFAKESLLDGAVPQYQGTMSDEFEESVIPYVISTNDDITGRTSTNVNDPSKANDMLGYLRKSISARRAQLEPQQQHDDEMESSENRASPRVRSKDQKYNTIRSMFESKRTAPIIPPNESWQYAGSYTGTNTSSVVLDHSHSNISNNAMIGGGIGATIKSSSDHNDRPTSRSGGASYGSSTFSDPFQFDL